MCCQCLQASVGWMVWINSVNRTAFLQFKYTVLMLTHGSIPFTSFNNICRLGSPSTKQMYTLTTLSHAVSEIPVSRDPCDCASLQLSEPDKNKQSEPDENKQSVVFDWLIHDVDVLKSSADGCGAGWSPAFEYRYSCHHSWAEFCSRCDRQKLN